MGGGQFDLLQQLQQRLESVIQDKTNQHELVRSLDEKMRIALLKAPKRPQLPEEKLEDEIQQLEFRRNTVSMSLNEEKQLLKQMDGLKEKKNQIKEYIAFQQAMDDMKQKKADALQKAKNLDQTAIDMKKGLRKLELAKSVKCNPSDIITIQVAVPNERVGGVIGRSGAKLKQIEKTCNVIMDVDNGGEMVQIMGTLEGTNAAKDMVEDITCSTTETIGLHPDVVHVLLNRKGVLLQQIQNDFRVRLDLNRAEGTVVINGVPAKIALVKKWIHQVSKGKKDVNVDSNMIPVLIGKGGATIYGIMEESGANVEIDRDASVVRLRGTVEAVEKAALLVDTLIRENEEHTEEHPVESHFISYLVEDKGLAMKRLRKGVMIDIDRPNSLLKVRGNTGQLLKFKGVLDEMCAEYNASTTKFPVDSHIISVVIGKGGSTIKKIQSDCNIKIDVDRPNLFLRLRGDVEAVEKATRAIEQIILENQRYVFGVSNEILAALTSKGRSDLLAIQEKTGCTLTPLRRELELVISGTSDQVAAGKAEIELFLLANQMTTMDIDPDDITNIIGPAGETITKLQEDTGAILVVDKKDNIVQLRGSAEQLEAAKAAILAITVGTGNGDNVLIRVDECATPTIIGKGGSSINRLREEYSVSIDVNRDRGTVRIKGEPSNVEACTAAINTLIEETMISDVIDVPVERLTTLTNNKSLFREIESATSSKITFLPKERKVRLRASAKTIGPAKRRLTMIVKDHLSEEIFLCQEHIQALSGNGGMNIQRVRDQNRVSITIDHLVKKVVITGSVDNVFKAKDETERLVQFYYPQNFKEISVPFTFLGVVDAKRRIILGDTTVNLSVLRRNNTVKIYGNHPDELTTVENRIESALTLHSKEYAEVSIDPSMCSYIVGKKGVTINQLSEESGALFHVDSDSNVVVVTGAETNVKQGVLLLSKLIETHKREYLDIQVDVNDIPSIIGRGGAVIRKLQETSGASINVNGDTGLVRVHSQDPENLTKAKELIVKLIGSNQTIVLDVDSNLIKGIIGKGGATIRGLQDEFRVKIEVDRGSNTVSIYGPVSTVALAKQEVERLIAEEQELFHNAISRERQQSKNLPASASSSASRGAVSDAVIPDLIVKDQKFPSIPVGADAAMAQELVMKSNSKNQRRRARKRQEQQSTGKAADVISLLVGDKPNTKSSHSQGSNPKYHVDEKSQDSSYYHSTTGGYTLRL